jgi:hypothetical protein
MWMFLFHVWPFWGICFIYVFLKFMTLFCSIVTNFWFTLNCRLVVVIWTEFVNWRVQWQGWLLGFKRYVKLSCASEKKLWLKKPILFMNIFCTFFKMVIDLLTMKLTYFMDDYQYLNNLYDIFSLLENFALL